MGAPSSRRCAYGASSATPHVRDGDPAPRRRARLDGRQEVTSVAASRDLTGLATELRGIVGDEHVVNHEHQLRTYASDGLLQYAVTPGLVVLPGSAEEVLRVVAACHTAGTPFVARGAGSGLFFFQAEDGIRVLGVTGVQTCALPISLLACGRIDPQHAIDEGRVTWSGDDRWG